MIPQVYFKRFVTFSAGAVLTAALMVSVLPRQASAISTQQALEKQLNWWLAGSAQLPATQQLTAFALSGPYALVEWTIAGGNAGGQLLEQNSGGTWSAVYGSGGQLTSGILESKGGVDQADAVALETPANMQAATPDEALPSPVPSATMALVPSLTIVRKAFSIPCAVATTLTYRPGDYDYVGTMVPGGDEYIESISSKPHSCNGNAGP